MKTLNKKNLKIINDLIFMMRTNDDCRNDILNQDVQTDEEKKFTAYLFWDTQVLSIELYENYGISYFPEVTSEKHLLEKEEYINYRKRTHKRWLEANKKLKASKKVA